MLCMLHATVATYPRYDVHCMKASQDGEGLKQLQTAQHKPLDLPSSVPYSVVLALSETLMPSLAHVRHLTQEPRSDEFYWTK